MDPDINSTRVQQWNVTVERQLGAAWQVSASYLGSYADRLWGQVHINPGTFMGLGPCTIAGVSYPSCTVTGNVDRRRTFYLENPVLGQGLGPVVQYDDVGEQTYSGLKLSFRRRADNGLSLSGNYTISHCEADTDVSGSFGQFTNGYTKPHDPVVRPRQLLAEPAADRQPERRARRRRSSTTPRCACWRLTGGSRGSSARARAAG